MKRKEQNMEHKPDDFDIPVDHGWAWMVLIGTFGICMLVIGGMKSFGVLLVEFTREYKSPQSLLSFVQSLTGFFFLGLGPLANALSAKYSFQVVVMAGGIMTSVGLVLTSFARSIEVIFLTYGFLTGIGFGFAFSPSMVILVYHFKKRRSLAIGVGLSGSGVGSMLLPYLNRFLIDRYSLQGCMLIIGGIMGNIIILGALYRPFSKYPRKQLSASDAANIPLVTVDESGESIANSDHMDLQTAKKNQRCEQNSTDEQQMKSQKSADVTDEKEHIIDLEKPWISTLSAEYVSLSGSVPRLELDLPLYASIGAVAAVSCQSIPNSKELLESKENLQSQNKAFKSDNKSKSRRFGQSLISHVDCSLLMDLQFILYFVFIFLVNIGYHSIFNALPSFAEEIGMTDSEGALLITVLGVVDLSGRVFFGWISDIPVFVDKRKLLFLVCVFIAGLGIFFIPLFSTFASMSAWILSFGMFTGGYNGLNMTVLVDSVGVQRLSSAWGFVCFSASFAVLATPVLVGFLKDRTGTWVNAFRVSGSAGLLAFVFVVLEYLVERSKKKASKEHQQEVLAE